ncbi:hypothetical protein MKK70_22235 [Methylobacterium sp. E-041]|uniref:hypothetical protein n=1 Tax=Methylobacterium sp. E-041 TaxID=2836573 RepID=UPI001FB94BB8|nr:hypothetical protein [Methylobacterium sp. E-041]MCJ2108043.1 hypothetical protein [Methylobacterium sp. E-041]
MKIMVPAGDTPTCGNCRFYAAANQRAGECRRSAPDFSDDSRRASWPILVPSGWCGELEQRLVPAMVSQDQ